MNFIKLLLLLSLVGFSFNYWQEHYSHNGAGEATISNYGFITLPKPTNLDTDKVIILAAINCTKEAAIRADNLADELSRRNIPYTRINRISFQNYDSSIKKNLDAVMGGPLPHVLIDGKGKANPSLNDVISEFNSIYE